MSGIKNVQISHSILFILLVILPGLSMASALYYLPASAQPFKLPLHQLIAIPDNENYQKMKNPEFFKKALQTKNDTTYTIQSDFVQEKNLAVLSDKIITKGSFYFKKPKKLRWEYTDPFHYVTIINADDVMIEDKGNKSKFNMGNNKLFRQVNDLLVNLIQGRIFNDEDYSATILQNAHSYKVELIPVDQKMKDYIKTIHIVFNKKTLVVQKVKMIEESGDYTLINFKNKRLNQKIPDKLFEI